MIKWKNKKNINFKKNEKFTSTEFGSECVEV
jgi:hypothetical protein